MTSTETTTEIAAYRTTVREKAAEYRNSGYANQEEWNKTMVHLGLEPFPTKQIKVTKKLDAVLTKSFDAPAGDEVDIQAWVERNRSGLISHYDVQNHVSLAPEDSEIEVVETTPGVEGEEPLPGADTEDLKVFKRLVRREALRLREVFEWCEGGTDTALTELGLPPVSQSVRIPVDVTVIRRMFIPTDAADREEALEIAASGGLQAQVANNIGTRERLVDFAVSDPDAHFRGDPDPTDYPALSNSSNRASQLGRCATVDPASGYACTWEDPEHTADHVAASYGEIVAVWPR